MELFYYSPFSEYIEISAYCITFGISGKPPSSSFVWPQPETTAGPSVTRFRVGSLITLTVSERVSGFESSSRAISLGPTCLQKETNLILVVQI